MSYDELGKGSLRQNAYISRLKESLTMCIIKKYLFLFVFFTIISGSAFGNSLQGQKSLIFRNLTEELSIRVTFQTIKSEKLVCNIGPGEKLLVYSRYPLITSDQKRLPFRSSSDAFYFTARVPQWDSKNFSRGTSIWVDFMDLNGTFKAKVSIESEMVQKAFSNSYIEENFTGALQLPSLTEITIHTQVVE